MIYEDSSNQLYIKDREDSLYILSPLNTDGNYEIRKRLLFHPEIFQFQETGLIIYIATNAGLFQLHKNNLSIEKSAINDVMPSMVIKNLLVEGNKIWLFGERGLYSYDTTTATGRIFIEEDGLPSAQFNEYSMTRRITGDYIVGTANGLMSFNPEKFRTPFIHQGHSWSICM